MELREWAIAGVESRESGERRDDLSKLTGPCGFALRSQLRCRRLLTRGDDIPPCGKRCRGVGARVRLHDATWPKPQVGPLYRGAVPQANGRAGTGRRRTRLRAAEIRDPRSPLPA